MHKLNFPVLQHSWLYPRACRLEFTTHTAEGGSARMRKKEGMQQYNLYNVKIMDLFYLDVCNLKLSQSNKRRLLLCCS